MWVVWNWNVFLQVLGAVLKVWICFLSNAQQIKRHGGFRCKTNTCVTSAGQRCISKNALYQCQPTLASGDLIQHFDTFSPPQYNLCPSRSSLTLQVIHACLLSHAAAVCFGLKTHREDTLSLRPCVKTERQVVPLLLKSLVSLPLARKSSVIYLHNNHKELFIPNTQAKFV